MRDYHKIPASWFFGQSKKHYSYLSEGAYNNLIHKYFKYFKHFFPQLQGIILRSHTCRGILIFLIWTNGFSFMNTKHSHTKFAKLFIYSKMSWILKSRDWPLLWKVSKQDIVRSCTNQNWLIYLIIAFHHIWVQNKY